MALIQRSILVPSASGRVGNSVFVRSPAGIVLRERVIPANPRTALQTAVRLAIAGASDRWRNTLTANQRDAWELYAHNTPVSGQYGQTLQLSGWNMFSRQAVLRTLANAPAVNNGPTNAGVPAAPLTPAGLVNAGPNVVVTLNAADTWRSDPTSYCLCSLSTPQSATRRTRSGYFQFTKAVSGNSDTPVATIQIPPLWGAPQVGKVTYLKMVVVDGQGRVSAASIHRLLMA